MFNMSQRMTAFGLALTLMGVTSVFTACEKKKDPTYSIGFNFHLVGQGADTPDFRARVERLLETSRVVLEKVKMNIGSVEYYIHTGNDANRLTYLDDWDDNDGSGIPDKWEELISWSSKAQNNNIDIFLVRSIGGDYGILGYSGGIPGPARKGTSQSGLILNTFGNIYSMPDGDLSLQGETLIHEAGHYLGLWHTTERKGMDFDPLSDTPECPSWSYDFDSDGLVSPKECYNQDGQYLMFWAAADFEQHILSGQSVDVIKTHPWVKEE